MIFKVIYIFLNFYICYCYFIEWFEICIDEVERILYYYFDFEIFFCSLYICIMVLIIYFVLFSFGFFIFGEEVRF